MITYAFLALLSGVLSFLSPCVLPLAPLYIAYFSGAGTLDTPQNRAKLIVNLLAFFIGFTAVYLVIGMSISFFFAFMQKYYFFKIVLGLLMILFAFHYWKVINIPLLNMDTRKIGVRTFSFASSFIFGILFAAGWSPCMGPLLGSVIELASNISGIYGKLVILFMYCLGIIIPFTIIAIMSVSFRQRMKGINKYLSLFGWLSGTLLFVLGVWIILS